MFKIIFNSEMENFKLNELPYNEFEGLGFDRERVLNMKKEELERLLKGGKTDLKMFKIGEQQIEGKLSLQRNPDNSVSLLLHPAQKEINNSYGFGDAEIQKLQNGELIAKTINGERTLFQLDRETNEILSAKTRGLVIPLDIKTSERERLLNGQSLKLTLDDGKEHKFRLDMLNPNGYNLDNELHPTRYVGRFFRSTELPDALIRKYQINENDLQQLLDGKRTELKQVDGQMQKLSLQRNPDNSVSLMLHPAQKEINNSYGFGDAEIQKLQNGELIAKTINGERTLFQLDRETNEILKQQEKLAVPSSIVDIELSGDQKERLRQGQNINLTNKNGENVTAKIDLGSCGGLDIKGDREKLRSIYMGGSLNAANTLDRLSGNNKSQAESFIQRNGLNSKNLVGSARAAFDRQQAIDFDFYNPGFCCTLQTDQNRGEFMESINKGQKM